MSRRYGQGLLEAGDLTHPWDLNANLLEIAGEVNGRLDRDNVTDDTLVAADFSTGAFGSLLYDSDTSTVSVSNTAGSTDTGWVRLTGTILSWTSRDGRVLLEGRAICERSASSSTSYVSLGLELDGEVIATSEPVDFNAVYRDTLAVQVEAPLVAGPHQAFLCARVQQFGANASTVDVSIRGLLADEVLV